MTDSAPPPTLAALAARYDRQVLDVGRRRARIRLEGAGDGAWDAVLHDGRAELQAANGRAADAVIRADERTWRKVAADLRGGMEAFRAGRLLVRRDLHLGVGFLAATSAPDDGERRLRFVPVRTAAGEISTMQAGDGPPVVMLHGLGATKASFLPTVAALADRHRAIAIDLPGFGDSSKPLRAPYHAPWFARAVVDLLDSLELERADVIGNSMGGRVAIELGLRHPERVRRLALLAPSLAWLRDRPWAPLLRLVPPQLGAIQPAPRPLVEAIVRRAIPGAGDGWTAAGVDEFLRSYLTPAGRAAFYAAARNIYLEEPHGEKGFWTRLPRLEPPALFVWGRQDQLVPARFARHVRAALPAAEHLELSCGHVPQLEQPQATHDAIRRFLRRR
ncbi:MAG TPA: alpha/beta fold hydrolase [Solirubrobacteraceae bacterium]|jgi:pimeloyl-ACP methyl ester carboxylesterase|nr:alpha/beta fold hydrolase [Solirubrobacteraceae bacterium]